MILDTSILIEILGNNVALQDKLERLNQQVSTTAVTKYELLRGQRHESAIEMLANMEIYEFDGKTAERCAKIFRYLNGRGKLINELDILIASIAIAHDELLVTRDNDFKSVDHLKLLVL